ncbi:MAG: sugar dehydratase, partial [Candidatus Aenigmarchaeota archaeon]|nr:sugar dehydratase [Candidatus Aenigmarchaeota archaeon]
SNAPINMLDLTKKIIEASGKDLKPDVQGARKPDAEIDRQYLSAEKAAAVLGWKPKVKLEDGLKRTIAWYEDYFSKIGKAE